MRIIFFILVVLGSFFWEPKVFANYNKSLPLYKGMIKEVKFWEKIFDGYTSKECVFHDSKHLDMVYMTKVVKKTRGSTKNSNYVIHEISRIKKALKNISRGKTKVDGFTKLIYSRIPKRLRLKSFYTQAPSRIRCQRGVTDHFQVAQKRSKKYMPMIKRELRRLNLPKDLAYLPFLESGFHNRTKSKVGAKGLWQFMPETGRRWGLKVNRKTDQRVWPIKSTRAALKKLKYYHGKINVWGLTLTAHNYGINGVLRAIKKLNTKDYVTVRNKHHTSIFKFAAKNFYPSFIAVRNIARKSDRLAASKQKRYALKKLKKKKRI